MALGLPKEKQRVQPPADASELADVVLPRADGGAQRLGDLWPDGPAVLVWLRHYW